MSHAPGTFWAEKLTKFIGHKVEGVTVDQNDEFFGLILTKGKSKTIVWIMEDDEGNGPGSLDIQEGVK
jgi:hypothetical protein